MFWISTITFYLHLNLIQFSFDRLINNESVVWLRSWNWSRLIERLKWLIWLIELMKGGHRPWFRIQCGLAFNAFEWVRSLTVNLLINGLNWLNQSWLDPFQTFGIFEGSFPFGDKVERFSPLLCLWNWGIFLRILAGLLRILEGSFEFRDFV